MNGLDFLGSAERLLEGSAEPADMRSSVSRSYYAAYHIVLQFLNACGIHFDTSTTESHTKMPWCFEQANVPDMEMIGRQLNSLRGDRRIADYELNNTKFDDPGEVRRRLQYAERIAELVDGVTKNQATYSNIRLILRQKARGIGITVVS